MSSAAAPPAAAASAAAAKVPPLSLTTVKARYPNLFETYTRLSDRELEGNELCDMDPAPTDAATGLATKIMFVDFTQPLADNGDLPMKTESDANKFCMFLWKMLSASESGSIGGDACRFLHALFAAYDDIMEMDSTAAKFEHLMGWVIAVVNHVSILIVVLFTHEICLRLYCSCLCFSFKIIYI